MTQPTTYDDLFAIDGMTDREAQTIAAVLPYLPDDERIVAFDPTRYFPPDGNPTSDADKVDRFTQYHRPIIPDGRWYRAARKESLHDGHVFLKPTPHGGNFMRFRVADVTIIEPSDQTDYRFDDAPNATLTDFGITSPYFDTVPTDDDRFDRYPRIPA